MNRFKKILTLMVVAAVVVPMSAHATISRVIGLGGEHVNAIVIDQANYLIWPQLVKNYGTVANAEFGGGYPEAWDLHSVSANYDWGDDGGVINFALNKGQQTRYSQMVDAAGDGPGINNALTLRYGRKMGGDNLIGIGLNYAAEAYERKEGPKIEQSASVMGIDIGYSFVEQNLDLVLGFEFAGFTNENAGATVTEANGMSNIMFAGRWWWDYSDKAALIPNLGINMTADNAKDAAGNENNITSSWIKLGAGHDWWPADNALVIFDFGFEIQATETEAGGSTSTDGWTAIPYWRVGAETKIFEWLDGRIGAERNWAGMLQDGDTPNEQTWMRSVTDTYVGASAHWNRLLFDVLVNPDFFNGGPYFISGDNSNGMFSRVSMKYNFNK